MCVTLSVFVQVTVVPAVTFSSGGANARFPSVAAFAGIETDALVWLGGGGAGDGAGEGAGEGAAGGTGLLSLPQAAANPRLTVMSARRTKNM